MLKTVVSDLEYLGATWGSTVDDDTLRRGSAQLRILLVDGMLQRAWKAAGFDREPTVIAPCLETFLDRKDSHKIWRAFAGGGNYEGIYAAFGILQEGSGPVSAPEGSNPIEYPFGLRKFTESCGIYAEKRKIKRREIIKYVANKLGGTHLDSDRSDPTYGTLDKVFDTFNVMGKKTVYFELLSIGQLLARSPDIKKFIEKVITVK